MYQPSLSPARIYPQQGLVVPASRKMKSSVAAEIKINGHLMPTIYWSLLEAMDACAVEKQRGCAVMTDIVHL